jgi:chromate transporter
VGALPFWEVLRRDRRARRALRGVNAGVVGILAAALVTPVLSEGVTDVATGLLAIGALLGLSVVKVPAWAVVIAGGAVGGLLL